MDQPTTEEQSGMTVIQIVEDLWKANAEANNMLAQMVWKFHEKQIPPIVASLPGINAFLSDLQKRSFALGVMALMTATLQAQQNSAVPPAPEVIQ